MNTMRTVSLLLVVGALGCASSQAPAELIDARAAYNRGRYGQAAKLDPADLHAAKKTLDRAEASFDEDGDTRATRDLAYVATRRAQIAEARASAIVAQNRQQETTAAMHAQQASALRNVNQQLTDQQLADSEQKRVEAQKRLDQAAAALAKYATIKKEPRGTVITLSGGVLFATGKTQLMPAAQAKLDEVAKALSQQDREAKLVVEGHTDSQGAAAFNQKLSEERAEAVREYLVSQGIAEDRITAEGLGATRPIAENESPEGRANNRRVEIVVEEQNGEP